MKFTVVFPCHESQDLSVGVVFTPCISWVQGKRLLLNPHPDKPHYRKGDLQKFLDDTGLRQQITTESKNVSLIAHSVGHGTEKDLALLHEDLWEAGFEVTVVRQ